MICDSTRAHLICAGPGTVILGRKHLVGMGWVARAQAHAIHYVGLHMCLAIRNMPYGLMAENKYCAVGIKFRNVTIKISREHSDLFNRR